jgi:hypothetical protein
LAFEQNVPQSLSRRLGLRKSLRVGVEQSKIITSSRAASRFWTVAKSSAAPQNLQVGLLMDEQLQPTALKIASQIR